MKTTLLTRLLASVVLALGLTAVNAAPIPLEDVKVGATVTREGISLGWGDHLPVPEGEWEVVTRESGENKGTGPFEHAPRIILTLLNKNASSPLQIVQILTAVKFKNRQSAQVSCPNSSWILTSDRLGTIEGQNFQLCKAIYKPNSYNSIFEWRSKSYTKLEKNEIEFLFNRFNDKNPILTTLVLKGGSEGHYRLEYLFGVSQNKNNEDLENWLNLNIKKIDEHYSGKLITFTEMQ